MKQKGAELWQQQEEIQDYSTAGHTRAYSVPGRQSGRGQMYVYGSACGKTAGSAAKNAGIKTGK